MWHSVSSYCLTPTCVWLVVCGGLDSTSHVDDSFGNATIVELSEFKTMYTSTFMYLCMVYVCVYIHMCLCIYFCMYAYMYVYIYIFIIS